MQRVNGIPLLGYGTYPLAGDECRRCVATALGPERTVAGGRYSLDFGIDEARDTVTRFRRHDESMLARQFAVHRDEDRLIQTSKEAAAELESLFDSDRSDTVDDRSATPADLARTWR